MYCSSCGKQIPADAKFCVHCGTQVFGANAAGYVGSIPTGIPSPLPPYSGLYRSRSQRMIAGLCGGMAATYGWDLSVVRLIAVLGALFVSPVILPAYLMAWIIVPEEPYFLPYEAPSPTTTSTVPPPSA